MTTDEKVTVSISGVPIEIWEKIKSLADKDIRTPSAYVRILLEKHVQATETFALAELEAQATQAA